MGLQRLLFFDVGGYSELCDEDRRVCLLEVLFFDVGGYSKPGDGDSPDCLRRLPLVEIEDEEEKEEAKEVVRMQRVVWEMKSGPDGFNKISSIIN